jgi:hypothetical protein
MGTSNCTYAPLSYVFFPSLDVVMWLTDSDNPYLSNMIDSGQALTVRIMLPTGKPLSRPFASNPTLTQLPDEVQAE